LTDDFRQEVTVALSSNDEEKPRIVEVLSHLGINASRWYYRPVPKSERKQRIRVPITVPAEIANAVVKMAEDNPWYGYKRIAVMCRREEVSVSNRQAYRVMKKNGLLHNRPTAKPAELHQARKLYELLPQGPNELWQTDVTYIHIPGYGWHYAVTVIDYYSRYLLACRFTWSYSAAEAVSALKEAIEEAERIRGPLKKPPFLVTDNGTSFVAKRFREFTSETFSHVRIRYRTPTQLGLLERFHRTLKQEEIYWQEYENPGHCKDCLVRFKERYNTHRPHWALIPEEGGDPVTPYEVYVGKVRTQIPKWQGWAKGAKKKLDEMMEAS
jgi:putative transposase